MARAARRAGGQRRRAGPGRVARPLRQRGRGESCARRRGEGAAGQGAAGQGAAGEGQGRGDGRATAEPLRGGGPGLEQERAPVLRGHALHGQARAQEEGRHLRERARGARGMEPRGARGRAACAGVGRARLLDALPAARGAGGGARGDLPRREDRLQARLQAARRGVPDQVAGLRAQGQHVGAQGQHPQRRGRARARLRAGPRRGGRDGRGRRRRRRQPAAGSRSCLGATPAGSGVSLSEAAAGARSCLSVPLAGSGAKSHYLGVPPASSGRQLGHKGQRRAASSHIGLAPWGAGSDLAAGAFLAAPRPRARADGQLGGGWRRRGGCGGGCGGAGGRPGRRAGCAATAARGRRHQRAVSRPNARLAPRGGGAVRGRGCAPAACGARGGVGRGRAL
mmetsp:Transcript_48724/g.114059  ORF Transcript_48724/g.114059 Transcript_48724/m.114059 type:complete len:395 (+) Transcript_48724:933-2117(+)